MLEHGFSLTGFLWPVFWHILRSGKLYKRHFLYVFIIMLFFDR